MKRSWVLLAVCALALACSEFGGPRRSILLAVSEIAAPSELAAGAELVATITVVTGGCKAFDQFVTTRTGDRLTVEARGWDATRGQMCPTDVRYEAREYRAGVPGGTVLILAIRQPDGSELVREIPIR
jgi:hypothetical protein